MSWILLIVVLIGGDRITVTYDTGFQRDVQCMDLGWKLEQVAKEQKVPKPQWICLQQVAPGIGKQ